MCIKFKRTFVKVLSDIKDTGKSESSPAVYVKCTDGI